MKKCLFIALLMGAFSLCANNANAAKANVKVVEKMNSAKANDERATADDDTPIKEVSNASIKNVDDLYEVVCVYHTDWWIAWGPDGLTIDTVSYFVCK